MRLRSRGLGRKELVMDFREYEIVRQGEEIVIVGTIRDPVNWDFTIRMGEDDVAGLTHLVLRPTMLTTRTFSDNPGIPGRSRHESRTSRSTWTPAWAAWYKARVTSGSSSAFILNWIRPCPSRRCFLISRSIFSSSARLKILGDGKSLWYRRLGLNPVVR